MDKERAWVIAEVLADLKIILLFIRSNWHWKSHPIMKYSIISNIDGNGDGNE